MSGDLVLELLRHQGADFEAKYGADIAARVPVTVLDPYEVLLWYPPERRGELAERWLT